MSEKLPSIRDIQIRIANTSIGPSTLRGQGAKCVAKTAREYLANLDLTMLEDIDESRFCSWLDNETEELRRRFPEGAQNWGAARKALNVFLENAFYDRFLSKEYGLDRLEGTLEIPLDKQVAAGLKKDREKNRITCPLPNWDRIKTLTPEVSKRFQDCASEIARAKRTSRIFLDLEYWRREKRNQEQR